MPEQADAVVIGSGIAGALCAYRLAQKGLKVLVLEAGPRVDHAEIVRGFSSSPHLNLTAGYPNAPFAPRPEWRDGAPDRYIVQSGPQPLAIEYLRLVGGTTWHWTAGTDRLLPVDFRMKSVYGVGADWPIAYGDLEPYYLQAEHELGVAGADDTSRGMTRSGPLPMPPVEGSYADRILGGRLAAIGIPLRPRASARNSMAYDGRPQCDGYGTCTPLCPIRAQYSAIVHVEKAERLGARVLAESRVDRIVAEPSGRIREVAFGRPDGSADTAAAEIFVLAANGIESPRLLLASAGDAYPRGLANSSDQVGRNLMDHPGTYVHFELPFPVYANRGPLFTSIVQAFRDGPLRGTEAAFSMAPDGRAGLFELTAELLGGGILPPALDSAIRERVARRISFLAEVEQLPDPNNRVTIDWSDRDSAGQPRIHLRYSIGDYERRGLARVGEVFDRIAAALEATRAVRSGVVSSHHPMGTIRMGADPRTSALDAFGRAHDHRNLFVCGSAPFVMSASGHPTLTIAALSLRTADAILKQMRP